MPVHIYGHPVDMDPVLSLAGKYHLTVIEDAAEVHGAEYKGRKCGSLGSIGAFSFYANKIITTGEGGMVLTSDRQMAERARSYRNLCFRPERRFYHTELGNNYRMTNLQAAIGVAQMERIEEFIQLKRRMGRYYQERLSDLIGIRFQKEKPWAKSVYWMFGIELDESLGMSADQMMTALGQKGIGTRPFFLGLHEQPVLHQLGLFQGEHYPVAERIGRQGLYLPSGLSLNDQQMEEVVVAVHSILSEKRSYG
jgi:perosamine synthetase